MERYNFQKIEKNGKNFGVKTSLSYQKKITIKKNFIALKCFLIRQAEFIWGM
jgi:hypothetical protein